MLFNVLAAIAAAASVQATILNIPQINRMQAPAGAVGGIKSAADLLYSGEYVCDKFASTIQLANASDAFPVDFNLYVANSAQAPNDNYTVDLYFKNPNHQLTNDFAILNTSDQQLVLEKYNPLIILTQPGFGVEFKFSFAKGLLCQFMYEFTVLYQLESQSDHSKTSDKIFLVGSCQQNAQFYPDEHQELVSQGFRCLEYNSGFEYDGGEDWCSKFYPLDQCCKTYEHDELSARDTCPALALSLGYTSLGEPTSSVYSGNTLRTVALSGSPSTPIGPAPTAAVGPGIL